MQIKYFYKCFTLSFTHTVATPGYSKVPHLFFVSLATLFHSR